MIIEKEQNKELLILIIIIMLLILSPLIIFKMIYIYEEHDSYKYVCKDALGKNYSVEHIVRGHYGPDKINLGGKIITIVEYERIKK